MPWIIDISFDGFGLFVIDNRGAASLTTSYLLFHQGIQEKNIPPRVKQWAFWSKKIWVEYQIFSLWCDYHHDCFKYKYIHKWYIYIAHFIIIIKSEVSTFPIVIIFFCGCVPEMFVTSYSVTYCIYVPGKPGICFHYYCAVYAECK